MAARKSLPQTHLSAHGEATVCIASDARFYWLAKGNPENAHGCRGGSACCASDGSAAGTLGRNVSGRGARRLKSFRPVWHSSKSSTRAIWLSDLLRRFAAGCRPQRGCRAA